LDRRIRIKEEDMETLKAIMGAMSAVIHLVLIVWLIRLAWISWSEFTPHEKIIVLGIALLSEGLESIERELRKGVTP